MLPDWLTRIVDQQIERSYVKACVEFADAFDTTHYGRNSHWLRALNNWQRSEEAYAARGYRTIPLYEFVEGFWGNHQPQGLGIKRVAGESPFFYAQHFRQAHGEQQRIVPNEMMTVVELPKGGKS